MSIEASPTSPLDERLRAVVRTVPDFPRPGILFRDLTPLMRDPEIWKLTLDGLASRVDGLEADLIVGIEARGFLVGNALALVMGRGFVPVRKPGKLPGQVESLDYQLEYGSDRLEIQSGSLEPGQKVLVVDDLLATGGTAAACAALVRRVGGDVVGYGFLAELGDLGGREKLPGPAPVESLLLY
jgi:adenine phosphoribosyltransferase